MLIARQFAMNTVEMNIHQVGVLEIKISMLIPFINYIPVLPRRIRFPDSYPIDNLMSERSGDEFAAYAFVHWLQCSMFFSEPKCKHYIFKLV